MASFPMTPEELRRAGHEMIEWLARYMEEVADLPITPQVSPGGIMAALPDAAPEEPEPFSALMADLEEVIKPGPTNWQSPGWFASFPANTSGPSKPFTDRRHGVRQGAVGQTNTTEEHVDRLWDLIASAAAPV